MGRMLPAARGRLEGVVVRERVEGARMRDATECCCMRATPSCRVASLFSARAREEEAMASNLGESEAIAGL